MPDFRLDPLRDIKSRMNVTGNYVGRVIEPYGHTIVARNGNPKLGPALSWQVRYGNCSEVSTVMQNSMHGLKLRRGCGKCAVTRTRKGTETNE